MQTKTMRYILILVRMAIIKRTTKTSFRKLWRKENPRTPVKGNPSIPLIEI